VNKLSLPARRVIAIALLIAAIALPWRLIVLPVAARFAESAEQVATQEDMLLRYRRLADSRDALRQQLQVLQAQPASQEGYLTGESGTLVAAELQNLVRTIVERNGGRLESTQILPPTTEGQFQRITLRVRMSTDTEGVSHIFYELESMLPYLFIDGLDIVSRDRRGSRRPDGDTTEPDTLSVTYDVYGFLRAG
jgi:general secretion pathway protein M